MYLQKHDFNAIDAPSVENLEDLLIVCEMAIRWKY